MAIRQLAAPEWGPYFDRFSKSLVTGKRIEYAEIRVFSRDLGSQVESKWMPLHGIAYDRRSDLVEIDIDGLGHLIYEPKTIYVDEDARGLLRLQVIRSDGTQEIIELR